MREFAYNSLLQDYALVQQGVKDLRDENFDYPTSVEREEHRTDLLEEIRKDYAFKLLTLLEADLREDFLNSIESRKRDTVSRAYRDLCLEYRRETRQISKRATQACSRMPLDRIFDKLRDCFHSIDEEFRRICSVTKGYFSFRNWYAHGRILTMPVVPDPEDIYDAYEQFREKVLDR